MEEASRDEMNRLPLRIAINASATVIWLAASKDHAVEFVGLQP